MADPRDQTDPMDPEYKLVPHRGFNLITGIHSPEEVDRIQDWKIRDSDVFAVTYPKSGTIWMQQILLLVHSKGCVSATTNQQNSDRVPWTELMGSEKEFDSAPSPRLRVTHLQYRFMPLGLRQRKGKVIYVARNPKDVLVSYYHFHKFTTVLETPKDFNDFFDKFMEGKVYGNCWYEHIQTWYSHRAEMNFLFIKYEDMIQDLRSVVLQICTFLEQDLTEEQVTKVVQECTFSTMKKNPRANYQSMANNLLDHRQGTFMRKGTIGDWKNHFTVAQNERFNLVYQEKMKDWPLSFKWDISDTGIVSCPE